MMITTKTLIDAADAFMAASDGLRESTLSYRIFGDTKKLTALRAGAEITLGRFNEAMRWLADNWPEGIECPQELFKFARSPEPPTTPDHSTQPPEKDVA